MARRKKENAESEMGAGDILIGIAGKNSETKGGYYSLFERMCTTAASPDFDPPLPHQVVASRGLEDHEVPGADVVGQAIMYTAQTGDQQLLSEVISLGVPMAVKFEKYLHMTENHPDWE